MDYMMDSSNISASVVCDSVSPTGVRISTLQLRYNRFIHSEFMTHRMLSKNASSSRAIPATSVLSSVESYPAMPEYWGKNQPGMQASAQLEGEALESARSLWLQARDSAVQHANSMGPTGVNLHKQLVNRITEPFQHINVVVTATEFANFFWLRNHKDAQPEIAKLARLMKRALDESTPTLLHPGEWHLPYVDFIKGKYFVLGAELSLSQAQKVSASACAQVSYRKNDLSLEKANDIWDRLIFSTPMHASPVEHQATPIDYKVNWRLQSGVSHEDSSGELWSANFKGWKQFRKTLEGEAVW